MTINEGDTYKPNISFDAAISANYGLFRPVLPLAQDFAPVHGLCAISTVPLGRRPRT